jgi:hypothetical protein
MCACDHLLDRAGGKVYLDNTFASVALKRDRIIKRIRLYLQHDMVRINSLHVQMHLIQSFCTINICVCTLIQYIYFRSSFQKILARHIGI